MNDKIREEIESEEVFVKLVEFNNFFERVFSEDQTCRSVGGVQ